jgi:hypothetical protein
MSNDNKTSIIKEALLEYSQIQEAAVANAKKNLADNYPDKFNELLKEEMNKNKRSYKKIDEPKDNDISNNEPDMKNQNDVSKKVVKENAGKDGVFTDKPKMPDMVKEEREKEFMGDVENDTPNQGKGDAEKGNVFTDKIKTKKDTLANKTSIKEEFNITELNEEDFNNALDSAEEDDEIITMNEIEEEIQGMENLGEELDGMGNLPRPELEDFGVPKGQSGDAYSQLIKMRKQLDEMINSMGGVVEQKNHGGAGANNVNLGGPSRSMIDEIGDDETITDADIEAALGEAYELYDEKGNEVSSLPDEIEMDEAHGVTYGNRRNTIGRHTPSPDYLSKGELDQSPEYVQESQKKISGLIKENKSLTKKLNETKKYKQSVTTLVEQYKSALEKYRNQLKEMATFNTNLAHVNNLLVNESLNLTQEDKIKIINEFKKVNTIAESQEKYKTMLSEMTISKKTLTESIEGRVSASVSPSSKQKLDEAKEVTAYTNDNHLNKMKKIIEYVEHRGSKKII